MNKTTGTIIKSSSKKVTIRLSNKRELTLWPNILKYLNLNVGDTIPDYVAQACEAFTKNDKIKKIYL